MNKTLGDPSLPPNRRRHRVAIAAWPLMMGPNEPRTATLPSLMDNVRGIGFEGLEYSHNGYTRYCTGMSLAARARHLSAAARRAGLEFFGGTLYVRDQALRQLHWQTAVTDDMQMLADLGCGFVNLQMELAGDYYNTAGLYRDDAEYLDWCADRVRQLQAAAHKAGLNFYLETHINLVTEDPAAACRLLDRVQVELTADLSHYFFRGFQRGSAVDRLVKAGGHTHTRLSRKTGDLSALQPDPARDWANKGDTWRLFQFMKPMLRQGLTSRVISGETGPMFPVIDSLTQEAQLLPLWRAMARYADAAVQGIEIKVDTPDDLKPWG